MKLVVLAGGRGTRLSEETATKPKPMVEIGAQPILWHILKMYAAYGVTESIICAGYRAGAIKEFFQRYCPRSSPVTFDLESNSIELHGQQREPWKVTVVDTGEGTQTGGRVRRVRELVGNERFHLTYGDGLSDVNIASLEAFHERGGALVTVTAICPPARFGVLGLTPSSNSVTSFGARPDTQGIWVNGGFFVVEPGALDTIEGDGSSWENDTLTRLAHGGKLCAYRHTGFWRGMDTLHDRDELEALWAKGAAPWKNW